jgi:hypothetical protein
MRFIRFAGVSFMDYVSYQVSKLSLWQAAESK